jgi:hypothetical protein
MYINIQCFPIIKFNDLEDNWTLNDVFDSMLIFLIIIPTTSRRDHMIHTQHVHLAFVSPIKGKKLN